MKFNMEFLRKLIAEFCASSMFVSLGCIGTTNNLIYGSNNIQRSVNWGLAGLAATQSFGCISGAHIQPCISIAAMIVQHVDIGTGLFYIVAQFLGTLFGHTIGFYLTKDRASCFCCTTPGVEEYKAALCEFYITAVWVFGVLAAWRPENENLLETVSLRIGFLIAACTIAGEPFSGASMNPFRSIIAACFANHFKSIWIYAVVPPVTAVVIAVLFRFIYNLGGSEGDGGGE